MVVFEYTKFSITDVEYDSNRKKCIQKKRGFNTSDYEMGSEDTPPGKTNAQTTPHNLTNMVAQISWST